MAKANANTNPESSTNPQGSSGGGSESANAELVEVTPLGMTPEQMQKSNPEAFSKLQQDAAAAALEEDKKRLGDLKAAFEDDAAYAMEAYEKGYGVMEAKAERHDVLAASNAELKETNTKLQQQVDENKVTFNDTDEDNNGGASSQSEDEVEAAAMKVWNANADLRSEFVSKSSFLADFKRHRKEYEKK